MLSLTDFMGWRFGWVAKTYVVLVCLFNMSIGGWVGGRVWVGLGASALPAVAWLSTSHGSLQLTHPSLTLSHSCLHTLSAAILAEYTTIGTLFGVYLGTKAVAITVTVGVLTLIYTTCECALQEGLQGGLQGVAERACVC